MRYTRSFARRGTYASGEFGILTRRGVAIILALLFGWTPIMPAFAQSDESSLPACCRRSGKHHCQMQAAQTSDAGALSYQKIREKCSYFPLAAPTMHAQADAVPIANFIFSGLVDHPANSAQAEAGFRISYHRSRQKRGPPPSLLS